MPLQRILKNEPDTGPTCHLPFYSWRWYNPVFHNHSWENLKKGYVTYRDKSIRQCCEITSTAIVHISFATEATITATKGGFQVTKEMGEEAPKTNSYLIS